LSNAENDSEQFEGRLQKVRSENEIAVNQKNKRIHELVDELKEAKERLKDIEVRAEKESSRNDAKVSGISPLKIFIQIFFKFFLKIKLITIGLGKLENTVSGKLKNTFLRSKSICQQTGDVKGDFHHTTFA
jgi:hypothetical protein